MGKIPVFEDPVVTSNALSKSTLRRFTCTIRDLRIGSSRLDLPVRHLKWATNIIKW